MNKFKIITFTALIGLVMLGFKSFEYGDVVSPLANKNTLSEVKQKLAVENNTFKLKEKNSLIKAAYAESLDVNPSAYAVIDYQTGDVISEKNLDKSLPIASVTKVMTAVVALDLADPKELITITKKSSQQIPTKIGVVPGEKMTLSELLEAMLLVSANDAAQAINDGIDAKYDEKVFIKAMNEKAKELGMLDSSFSNPQGFDSQSNYSSAKDLAILSKYALDNYPLIKGIVSKDYMFLAANRNHKQFDLQNWNGLLGVYPGADGIKIGNTEAAGKTTIVTAERRGKKILVVVLGAPGIVERDLWAARLLDLGFEEAAGLPKVLVTRSELLEKYAKWQYWN